MSRRFVIRKKGYNRAEVSYSGPEWDEAGIRGLYRETYAKDEEDIVLDICRKLTKKTGVRFEYLFQKIVRRASINEAVLGVLTEDSWLTSKQVFELHGDTTLNVKAVSAGLIHLQKNGLIRSRQVNGAKREWQKIPGSMISPPEKRGRIYITNKQGLLWEIRQLLDRHPEGLTAQQVLAQVTTRNPGSIGGLLSSMENRNKELISRKEGKVKVYTSVRSNEQNL
jgi:hypothetical protein